MKSYKVIGRAAGLSGGQMKLTDAQAAARAHKLKALGDGMYEVLGLVEFKAGETFGYDGELNKAQVHELQAAGEVQPETTKQQRRRAASAEQ